MKGIKPWIGGVFTGLYALGLLLAVAAIMAAHERPLRVASVSVSPSGAWHISHVLSSGCDCSAAVLGHLLLRGKLPDVTETVYFVTDHPDTKAADTAKLNAEGFDVTCLSAESARLQLGVNGGPVLIVDRPDGTRVYAGGYGEGRPSAQVPAEFYQDRSIVQALMAGRQLKVLPALGCSIDRSPASVWQDVVVSPFSER